jgi:hypothetical protein
MRTLLPKLGAKSEPDAISRLVLERTKALQHENSNLTTAGEVMTAFVDELRTRQDVREWESFYNQWANEKKAANRRAVNIDQEVYSRSVYVQAFQKYSGMSQRELGSALRTMKKDNPKYK